MIKILFVCHGNICRSPMAEFVLKQLIKEQGLEQHFLIDSAATSTEEIGNGVHHGTKRKLAEVGVSCLNHKAIQMTRTDYEAYDYLIGMDSANIRNMQRICGGDADCKIHRLLDFTMNERDIADPWYTGNFDKTYEDIDEGCRALLSYLKQELD